MRGYFSANPSIYDGGTMVHSLRGPLHQTRGRYAFNIGRRIIPAAEISAFYMRPAALAAEETAKGRFQFSFKNKQDFPETEAG